MTNGNEMKYRKLCIEYRNRDPRVKCLKQALNGIITVSFALFAYLGNISPSIRLSLSVIGGVIRHY